MMNKNAGFTLIELVAVIVVIGILAAVAVPKMVNLSDSAEDAAVKGTARVMSSVSALNHANNEAKDSGLQVSDEPVLIASCADVVKLLQGESLPDNSYKVTEPTVWASQEGSINTCKLSKGRSSATFAAIDVE